MGTTHFFLLTKTQHTTHELLFLRVAAGDEVARKSTLLEGYLKFTYGDAKAMIRQGKQAIVASGDEGIKIENGNVEQFVSWESGYFSFSNRHRKTLCVNFPEGLMLKWCMKARKNLIIMSK